jgi:hypothetical protein
VLAWRVPLSCGLSSLTLLLMFEVSGAASCHLAVVAAPWGLAAASSVLGLFCGCLFDVAAMNLLWRFHRVVWLQDITAFTLCSCRLLYCGCRECSSWHLLCCGVSTVGVLAGTFKLPTASSIALFTRQLGVASPWDYCSGDYSPFVCFKPKAFGTLLCLLCGPLARVILVGYSLLTALSYHC